VLSIMSNTMPVWLGWVLLIALVVGYAAVTFRQMTNRRSRGLVAQSPTVWALKIVGLAILLGLCTYYLSTERSRNPQFNSIKGIPIVIPVVLVLLIAFSMLLSKTVFGGTSTPSAATPRRRVGAGYQRAPHPAALLCHLLDDRSHRRHSARQQGQLGDAQYGRRRGRCSMPSAPAVIGGTSLFGGKGRPVDAIIGGLVVAVVANGMGLLDQTAAVVYMVTGGVLLLAAGVDALSRRRAAASGRA
jgi:D-xylose transport system permease protein